MYNTINTSINVIGSIPDYQFIYDVLRQLSLNASKDDIYESVINRNIYNIRTVALSGSLKTVHMKPLFVRFINQAGLKTPSGFRFFGCWESTIRYLKTSQ
jgi:hypothetical protein